MTVEKTQSPPESSAPVWPEIPHWTCLGLLGMLTLGIFAKVLFLTPHEVLSNGNWDLRYIFQFVRHFGFTELKAGNLALWNPHTGGGEPFFGGFFPALLYPFNALYLILPLDRATNWTIAFHVFLGGAFTFYWVRYRGLHTAACLLAAFMFMFCGPHFLQIHAGHITNQCVLIWAPLLFLAVDKMVDRPALAPCLLGMFAVGMAIMAGHPQYVFFLGIAAGIYALLQLTRVNQRGRILLGLAFLLLGAVALSAVQLFPGLQEGSEGIRSLGLTYDLASSYSFPPENLLTLIAPWFFGDIKEMPYWGRWFLTEVSIFVSVTGLILAAYGAGWGDVKTRRFSATMLLVTLVLALGAYTPLFHVLFNYAPGFNKFRGYAKFLWLAALFFSMLAAIGMDRLLRRCVIPRWFVLGVAGLGIFVYGIALCPRQSTWWTGIMKRIPADHSSLLPDAFYSDPRFLADSGRLASNNLIRGAVSLLVAASLLELARSRRGLACGGILAVALLELVAFAHSSIMTFQIGLPYSPGVVKFLAQHPGDYRVRHFNPYSAMTAGTLEISSEAPTELLRYARFLSFAEGMDFDTTPYGTPASHYNLLALQMLRCRYIFDTQTEEGSEVTGVLPQLLLVNQFRVMTNYHEIFSTLTNADFHLREEIILESQPVPAPQPSTEKGTVKLVNSSTDFLTIEANVSTPNLLLITDSYSRGWRALPLPGSSQTKYDVMPANYCLRAIPLAAGHHLLRLEYSPSGFRIGKAVSLVALPIFLGLCGWSFRQRRGLTVKP